MKILCIGLIITALLASALAMPRKHANRLEEEEETMMQDVFGSLNACKYLPQ